MGHSGGRRAAAAAQWCRLRVLAPGAQVVDGNRMVATQYDLSFRVDRDRSPLCKKTFTKEELHDFREVRGGGACQGPLVHPTVQMSANVLYQTHVVGLRCTAGHPE